MNILICDDIQSELARLKEIIRSSGLQTNTVLCDNGADAISLIRSGARVDVCFLDIIMPQMSGVVLAQKLRGNGFEGEIVFLTGSNDYAAESYQVEAFSYILKPISAKSVKNILYKLEEKRKTAETSGIVIKTGSMSRFVLFRDISHIEVIQHKVYFRLLDGGEIETNTSLGELAPKLLEDKRFARCHRSFVVNMNAISAIQGGDIILKCGSKVPISRSYADLKKQYLNRVFGGEFRPY